MKVLTPISRTLLFCLLSACSAASSMPESAAARGNGAFEIPFGDSRATVQPRLGGRITHLEHRGRELLSQASQVQAANDAAGRNQFGSTFWISPQARWGWPPEAAVDSAPYRVLESGNYLVLRSPITQITGLQVTKRFSAEETHLRVDYTLHNPSPSEASAAAAWEVTRVVQGGLVVFPASAPEQPQSTLHSQLIEGIAWLDISERATDSGKLFQDGSEGWLAYVHNGLALLKTFPDLAPNQAAEGEAEVEIYVNGTLDYLELEQQGPAEAIAAGQDGTPWSVQWRVRPLPAHIAPTVGNRDLVEWLREQAGQ